MISKDIAFCHTLENVPTMSAMASLQTPHAAFGTSKFRANLLVQRARQSFH